jgi:hypothetical protein
MMEGRLDEMRPGRDSKALILDATDTTGRAMDGLIMKHMLNGECGSSREDVRRRRHQAARQPEGLGNLS